MGPKCNDWCPYKRKRTHREDKATVKTEVGNAVTELQAKECQGLVEATEARKNQENILS